jgi:hypothetical protein
MQRGLGKFMTGTVNVAAAMLPTTSSPAEELEEGDVDEDEESERRLVNELVGGGFISS